MTRGSRQTKKKTLSIQLSENKSNLHTTQYTRLLESDFVVMFVGNFTQFFFCCFHYSPNLMDLQERSNRNSGATKKIE